MKPALLPKSLLAWAIILCLAVANGVLRESVLIPRLGGAAGLRLSGAILCLLILLVAYGLVRTARGLTAAQGLRVGALWLGLTLAFEFGFGLYVRHRPLAELLEAYTFKDGNLWPLVLAVTLLAPAAAARLHARAKRD
jgi:hypothetical protein